MNRCTCNLALNPERQALDYHRYEALAFHDFADIDEIQLGQAHFIDAWHVPLARKHAANNLSNIMNEYQSDGPIVGG